MYSKTDIYLYALSSKLLVIFGEAIRNREKDDVTVSE